MQAKEADLRSRTLGLPSKEYPNPGVMLYNFYLNGGRDEQRVESMDDIGLASIFRRPEQTSDGRITWSDDVSENDLERLLVVIGKAEVYNRINLADLHGKLHMCRLCGWLNSDNDKRAYRAQSSSSASGETTFADLFEDDGAESEAGDGKVEAYVYNNIARIVCHSVERVNPIDIAITAALYWFIKAVIPTDGKVPLLKPKEIYDHFFGSEPCVLDIRLRAAVIIRDVNKIMTAAKNSMIQVTASNRSARVDPTQAKVYYDGIKALREVYSIMPKGTLFHAPDLPIDTDVSNSLLGPSTIVRQSRKRTY